MLYQGNSISVTLLDNGIVEFVFDAKGSVNKFDQATFVDFNAAIDAINTCTKAKGVLITSAKPTFIVGADINEFLDTFTLPDNELVDWIKKATDTFDALEDIQLPTVVAINGFALGGGCEFILSCDYRIADTTASIGLPEISLGIMPGFGGTVRLPRLIGVDNAVEWITTARPYKVEKSLAYGVVDAVVAPENLRAAALSTLEEAIAGKLNWRAKRQLKLEPLKLSPIESMMSFSTCKGMIMAKAGKHYPAPILAVKTIEAAASLDRKGAMAIENKNFATLAKSPEATAQVGLYLADQVIKGKAKKAVKETTINVDKAAVLGAGIMGGGIAYQSAYKGTPIIMKDLNQDALDLGLSTASSLLNKLHERSRITTQKLGATLNNISTSLSYDSINEADVIVEAVVENLNIKKAVLAEVESLVDESTILTSNTSTISIDLLASDLIRKDKFCGMHFFNPVNKMPLVEVIRGSETSDETIATVVAYASKMGKSAIVVNDCPGFYVNRVLFPYFAGFSQLLIEGADFEFIDKVMEKEFGWPMGPAYLLDVVGIDTADHCTGVMSQGFPTRMAKIDNDPVSILYQAGHLGQKSGHGFYDHSKDKRGKPVKIASTQAKSLIEASTHATKKCEVSSQEVITRLMIPMVNEVIRCLEEGVIDTAHEADMGLIYGLGFPPFRGGPMRYIEQLGLDTFIEIADKYAHLGEIYQVTNGLRQMAKAKNSYFDTNVSQLSQTNNVNA